MGKTDVAYFAGGCFWGMEELLRKQAGVIDTQVGYTGGDLVSPTYSIVKTGTSGHAEAVKITYDSEKTSYEKLLKYFFIIHDPTTLNRQGNDIGTQYRSAIFFTSQDQKEKAQRSLLEAEKIWKKPITTQIVKFNHFTLAEDYHQDYLQRHPGGYTCHYERTFPSI